MSMVSFKLTIVLYKYVQYLKSRVDRFGRKEKCKRENIHFLRGGRLVAPHILHPPTLILEGDTEGEGDGTKTIFCSLTSCGADFTLTNQGIPEATTRKREIERDRKERTTFSYSNEIFIFQLKSHF